MVFATDQKKKRKREKPQQNFCINIIDEKQISLYIRYLYFFPLQGNLFVFLFAEPIFL